MITVRSLAVNTIDNDGNTDNNTDTATAATIINTFCHKIESDE